MPTRSEMHQKHQNGGKKMPLSEFFLFHMFPFSSGDFCSIIIHGTRYSECGLKNNNILCMSEG